MPHFLNELADLGVYVMLPGGPLSWAAPFPDAVLSGADAQVPCRANLDALTSPPVP
jgi:hypothetical protein